MTLERFTGIGSTASRRRFWDSVATIVSLSRKLGGSNVTADEYDGQGTLISIPNDDRGRQGGGGAATGACCHIDGTCEIDTQAHCEANDGEYQGDETTCEDEDVDCTHTGACCEEGDCAIKTQAHCEDSGGVYQGDGSDCDPNPCVMVDCPCGFDAYDGSGRRFLTETRRIVDDTTDPTGCGGNSCTGYQEVFTNSSIDPDTCAPSYFCSGGGHIDNYPSDCSSYDCDPVDIGGVCQPTAACECCGPGVSCTPVVDSATHKICTDSNTDGDCTQNLILEYTLSNECNPI